MPGVALVAPAPLTEADIAIVHDPNYVSAVRTGEPPLADAAGLGWDDGLWTSVCASNGGVVAAARLACATGAHAGSLSSGLHHARRNRGHGFCTFNGLALAARAVIEEDARRVLVLDLDAHCGGGTAAITAGWPEVTHVDVSVSPFDRYQPAERQTLHLVTDAAEYLPAIARALHRASGPWDLVIYNAGMHPHQDSAVGGLRGITTGMLAERERMVFTWARERGAPVAFVLAGGYISARLARETLADLHRLTIAAAADQTLGER